MGIASLVLGLTGLIGLVAGFLTGGNYFYWLAVGLSLSGLYLGLTAAVRRIRYTAAVAGLIISGLVTIASALALGITRGVN